jgi:hypothetical protein
MAITFNATLYWNCLSNVNDLSGKYQADLGNLSEKASKALTQLGVTVKTDAHANKDYANKEKFIVGKSKFPIKVSFDSGVDPVEIPAIGNGSRVQATIQPYNHQNVAKYGMGVGLNKIVVTEVTTYSKDDDDGGGNIDGDDEDTSASNAPFDMDEFVDE